MVSPEMPASAPLRPRVPGVDLAVLLPGAPAGVLVRGVSLSTHALVPGDLYAALPGAVTHGARFAAAAVRAGAVAVLTDPAGAEICGALSVPVVVDDAPRALMVSAALEVYGHPGDAVMMFGVTGTNGKTTVAFMVEAMLAAAGIRPGTIGTLGFRLDGEDLPSQRTTVTTPDVPDLQALLAVLAHGGAEAVVMEVSSHALALHRVDGLVFDVAAFTNLGADHGDFHPTIEDYFQAKRRLFLPGQSRRCVAEVDDPWGRRLVDEFADGTRGWTTVGDGAEARPGTSHVQRVLATPITGGSHVVLRVDGDPLEFDLSMPGTHNVRNASMAVAMLHTAGLDVTTAVDGLAHVSVPGRMQRVVLGPQAPTVYVDFAHTPQAIASALSAIDSARTIVVVGAGGDRDHEKRPAMGAAAVRGADVLVVTDDNPRGEDPATIRQAVLDGARAEAASAAPGGRAASCDIIDGGDRRSAIARAMALAGPADVVAVLGKGHETGQEIGGIVTAFSDVDEVVRQWNGRKGTDRWT